MVHSYSYDQKNRLTNLGVNGPSGPLASYAYTLDKAGHRTAVAELNGRTVNYGYDNIYRLTSEAVFADPSGNNGTINYTYDPVGNRLQQTSTNPAITTGGFSYDADDRLALDTYDANGNTIGSGGLTYSYDFENHLIQQGGATFVYDGDGNRVEKFVGGVTTKYLVSEVNPTGYPQVLFERITGSATPPYDLSRTYVYGLDRISQYRSYFTGTQSLTQTSYYVYDGHGSVRALTDPTGKITDTYDYDAFGNLTHSTTTLSSPTPNEFLFAGEQFDSNLSLYYNRARYLNVTTGRFWTMDKYDGDPQSPLSLHKYLYADADPSNALDPSGLYSTEYGKEVHRIVESQYETEFGYEPGQVFLPDLYEGGNPLSSVTPDILDLRSVRADSSPGKIWMDVKPLSLSGIGDALATWGDYQAVFESNGINPDTSWLAGGQIFPSSQGQVLVFNTDGILFYTTNQQDYERFEEVLQAAFNFAVASALASQLVNSLAQSLPQVPASAAAGSEFEEISSLARIATEADAAELSLDIGVAVY